MKQKILGLMSLQYPNLLVSTKYVIFYNTPKKSHLLYPKYQHRDPKYQDNSSTHNFKIRTQITRTNKATK